MRIDGESVSSGSSPSRRHLFQASPITPMNANGAPIRPSAALKMRFVSIRSRPPGVMWVSTSRTVASVAPSRSPEIARGTNASSTIDSSVPSLAYPSRKPEPPNSATRPFTRLACMPIIRTSPSSNPERPMPHWSMRARALSKFCSSPTPGLRSVYTTISAPERASAASTIDSSSWIVSGVRMPAVSYTAWSFAGSGNGGPAAATLSAVTRRSRSAETSARAHRCMKCRILRWHATCGPSRSHRAARAHADLTIRQPPPSRIERATTVPTEINP